MSFNLKDSFHANSLASPLSFGSVATVKPFVVAVIKGLVLITNYVSLKNLHLAFFINKVGTRGRDFNVYFPVIVPMCSPFYPISLT